MQERKKERVREKRVTERLLHLFRYPVNKPASLREKGHEMGQTRKCYVLERGRQSVTRGREDSMAKGLVRSCNLARAAVAQHCLNKKCCRSFKLFIEEAGDKDGFETREFQKLI